jgi:two-component system, cell cycle sensor histidine kinase and response regulator CckA
MGIPLRVLSIEDSEDDALLILRDLQRGGFDPLFKRVETPEALEAELDRETWDIVIADYVMPRFNGLEALKLMQGKGLDLPFIIVSGKASEEMLIKAMKAGVHDYILKGNLSRLVPAVKRELHEAAVRKDRKKAEEGLRKSEEKYRILVENANDAILIIQEEVIRFANAKTVEVLGYSQEELTKIPFVEHIHPDDRDRVYERYQERLKGEKLSAPYSFRIRNKSGKELWVDLNAVLVDWEGRPATLNFVRDVTERKKMEEQFLHAQKMEAVGQLAGGFAHDFNNSLTLISVCSQLALFELKKDDPLREKIETIHAVTERSASLARQLLAFSRRQVMETKILDLNILLKDIVKMLHRVIGERITLNCWLDDDLGFIRADPAQIDHVVANLVVNAKDAMPDGGALTIETANIELDREYVRIHPESSPGSYVLLSVGDTGAGMTPAIKDRIFEPFFTTKEKTRGTGLGLSSVYGIVKQSGGNIEVFSEPGAGTTFKIYFPRVEGRVEEGENELFSGDLPRGEETILIVEDEKPIPVFICQVLLRQGFKVIEAANAEEALLLGEKCTGPIDLLLTDVVMPGMNGRDLAERLLSLRPKMKVLYMSGYPDDVLAHHGVLKEGFNLMPKPFSMEGLVGKIRKVLKQRDAYSQKRVLREFPTKIWDFKEGNSDEFHEDLTGGG